MSRKDGLKNREFVVAFILGFIVCHYFEKAIVMGLFWISFWATPLGLEQIIEGLR